MDIVHISPLNPGDTDNNASEPVLPPSRQLQVDSSKQLSFVKNWFLTA